LPLLFLKVTTGIAKNCPKNRAKARFN